MSFLGAAFLFALPLVAAPLLLHLVDRRRNVEIQWAAMQFLVAATARKTSARRLKQWLLLLLRTLAIAALIFALARPLAPVGWLSGQQRSETILIVDNSMSMMRSTGGGTLLQQASDQAVAHVAKLSGGDFVRVLTTAPYPVWSPTGGTRADDHSRNSVAAQLQQVEPTLGRSDLLAALFTAIQSEPEPSVRRREVIVLTDGQRADWNHDDEIGWNRLRETLRDSAISTKLEFLELATPLASKGNVAVDRVVAHRRLVGIDQPVGFTAVLQNHSAAQVPPRTVTWRVDGEGLADEVVDALAADSAKEINWTHSFTATGTYQISCRIDHDDDLEPDNTASVVIEVVQRVPILIVEGAADLAEMQQDSFFVQAALGWVAGQPLEQNAVYRPTLIAPESLSTVDLHPFRAVVLPNLTELDSEAIASLHEFVAAGGGLWVGLGPRTHIDRFNQQWYAAGNGLSPVSLDRLVDSGMTDAATVVGDDTGHVSGSGEDGDAAAVRSRLTINPFAQSHPASQQLADSHQLDIGDVVVNRRFQFAGVASDSEMSVLLSLSNGQPLAVEKFVGSGRVIVQAIPLRLQWSDLARSQSFVVMVRDWMDYLSEPKATNFNLQPGEPIVLRAAGDEPAVGTLSMPRGGSIELAADRWGAEKIFRTGRTSLPGDYALEIGLVGEKIPFYVSRDVRESDLTPMRSQDRMLLAQVAAIQQAGDGTNAAGFNEADPLWPLLLIGLIGLITCDLLLSGWLARDRFGQRGIAESNLTPAAGGDSVSYPAAVGLVPDAAGHSEISVSRTSGLRSRPTERHERLQSAKPSSARRRQRVS